MGAYGLKGRSAAVLCRIFEQGGGMSATALVKACEVDKAQISRCLAELCEKGFVVREGTGEHRYKQNYVLTASGMAAAGDISRAFADIEQTVSKNIPPRELEGFYRTLYRLCDNFDALLLKYIEDSKHLWEEGTETLRYTTIGSVIGTHAGPGAVAVAFFKKKHD